MSKDGKDSYIQIVPSYILDILKRQERIRNKEERLFD